MRTITSTLLNAQLLVGCTGVPAGFRVPYIETVFYSIGGSYDYSARRLFTTYTLELSETAISKGSMTIYLLNDDNLVEDLTGSYIDLYIGDITSVGPEGRKLPRMYVKSQNRVSSPNSFMVSVECVGQEDILKQPYIFNTDAPYHYSHWADSSPGGIIGAVLQHNDIYLSTFYNDDGQIDKQLSDFEINKTLRIPTVEEGVPQSAYSLLSPHETYEDVIVRLLWFTYQYLIAMEGQTKPWYKFVYPATVKGDRVPDLTYYSYKDPIFYEFQHRTNLTDPNNILVYCDIDYELGIFNSPLLIGNAKDDDAYAKHPKVDIRWAGAVKRVGNDNAQADADTRANVVLSRSKMNNHGGILIIPHDMRPELLDLVEVLDGRNV